MSNEFAIGFLLSTIRLTCPAEHSGATPRRILVNPMQKPCSAQGNQTKIRLISLRRTMILYGIVVKPENLDFI